MPLRDLLIAAILALTLPRAFKHAYIGVLLWTWVSIMNPHKLAYGFTHNAPIAALIAAVTMISLFTTKDRVKLPFTTPVFFLAAFVVWMCITTIFAIFPGESANQLNKVLKIQVMVFISMAVLYKFEHIRLFIWVNVLSLGFYGVKGGIYTILTGGGGRVWGPPGGFIQGNNELALALIMAIPLMYFLRQTTPHKWIKHGLIVMMVLSAISAIGTQSRGALLALSAMGVVLWWRAPNKFLTGMLGAMVALVILAMMPAAWFERMDTIQNYHDDGSALGRINAWWAMYNLANDRILGGGYAVQNPFVFSLYAPDPTNPLTAHSIYFQTLGEHGYIGLILFLLIWWSGWKLAKSFRNIDRRDENIGWLWTLGAMVQVSFVGFAVGGAFLSLAYFDLPYNILLTLVVAQRWMLERRWETDERADVRARPGPSASLRDRLVYWIRTA